MGVTTSILRFCHILIIKKQGTAKWSRCCERPICWPFFWSSVNLRNIGRRKGPPTWENGTTTCTVTSTENKHTEFTRISEFAANESQHPSSRKCFNTGCFQNMNVHFNEKPGYIGWRSSSWIHPSRAGEKKNLPLRHLPRLPPWCKVLPSSRVSAGVLLMAGRCWFKKMSPLGPMVVYDCYVIGKCCTGRDWCRVLAIFCAVTRLCICTKSCLLMQLVFWGVTNVPLLYQLECFFSLLEKYSGLKKTGMFSCYLGSMLL